MGDLSEAIIWIAIWSVLIFILGFAIGDKSAKQYKQKEIVMLNIELTKLNIKKLKGECNETNR